MYFKIFLDFEISDFSFGLLGPKLINYQALEYRVSKQFVIEYVNIYTLQYISVNPSACIPCNLILMNLRKELLIYSFNQSFW